MMVRAASLAAAILLAAAPLVARTPQSGVAPADSPALLKPGPAIERTLQASERHNYDIELQSGQYATLTVDQHGIDVVITVLDPSGAPVAVFDDEMRKDAREHVGFVADATRPYRVTVSSRYPTHDPGAY